MIFNEEEENNDVRDESQNSNSNSNNDNNNSSNSPSKSFERKNSFLGKLFSSRRNNSTGNNSSGQSKSPSANGIQKVQQPNKTNKAKLATFSAQFPPPEMIEHYNQIYAPVIKKSDRSPR